MVKVIDGSQGEGGGQILRSSLTLCALTGQPIRIERIRAGRKKPGLLRQHLTAVRAVQTLCDAQVEGADLFSSTLEFRPGPIRPGQHSFAVGTAGSTTLICQTVLGMLLAVKGQSVLSFSGGTHNPMAPPLDFLEHVFLPVLERMGCHIELEAGPAGFYPAGGGSFQIELSTSDRLAPIRILEREAPLSIRAWTRSARVPRHVAERELDRVRRELGLSESQTNAYRVSSPGPGNVLCIQLGAHELVSGFGEPGRRAESVAAEAIEQARAYLAHQQPIGEHLADQLMLPFALVGGAYRTGPLSLHARTNLDVLRSFLGPSVVQLEEARGGAVLHFPGVLPS